MTELTKEAVAALASSTKSLNQGFEGCEEGSVEEQKLLAASAITLAIQALCYEVAALRDGTYTKLADIESTLFSK